ncbi:MAG: MFS transporter [Spirochaetes bacterium]|nr:MFS transporter [Spirochaetota bacterium]
MNSNAKSEPRLPRLILYSVTHLVHDLYQSFLSPILPVLIEKHDLSLKMAGYLNPALRMPSVFQPFIGYLADRRGTEAILPLTMLVTAGAICAVLVMPGYSWVLMFTLIAGVSAAFYHANAVTGVADASGGRYGTGMSFFMTGGELARSIGPVYIVFLIRLLSGNRIFTAALPAVAVAAVIFFTNHPGGDKRDRSRTAGFWQAIAGGKKGLLLLLVIQLLHRFTVYAFAYFLPTYLRETGKSLLFAGSALSLLEISGAFGAFIGGTVSDRIGKKWFFLISSFCIPLLINLYLQQRHIIAGFALLVIAGMFMLSGNPVWYAYAQDLVPEFKGTAASILMAFGFLTTTASTIAAGYLGDVLGLFRTYRILSFLPLLSVVFILMLPHEAPQGARPLGGDEKVK